MNNPLIQKSYLMSDVLQELIEELKPVMNPDPSYGDYPNLGAFEKESNM